MAQYILLHEHEFGFTHYAFETDDNINHLLGAQTNESFEDLDPQHRDDFESMFQQLGASVEMEKFEMFIVEELGEIKHFTL